MTDIAKQSLMAAGSGLLQAKGLNSSAAPGQVISAPELSNNLKDDQLALKNFNNALQDGATPAEAYADNLVNVSKAAQEAARQSNGLPVDIDKFTNAQTAASMATKVSTGAMVAQSVASAALTGAISMGVTLAVNGLVMGLDYLAHAHERAVEAVDNANAAYAENETALENASASLADIEERLNALNSIQNPSLADKEETAEFERQQEALATQVALLREKSELLKAEQAESGEALMEDMRSSGLTTSYSRGSGQLSRWEKIATGVAQGLLAKSSAKTIVTTPALSQQQVDMVDDMSMSAEEYASYWSDALTSGDIDRQSEQFRTVRENLLGIAEEYQKIAESSEGAIGDEAQEKVNQIAYALSDAEARADLFNTTLGDSDVKEQLLEMAASGRLTAENLAQIAGSDLANQLNTVSGSAQATVAQLTQMAQSGELAKTATENLRNATAPLAEVSQKIADIEGAVNAQRSLSASEVSNLCAKYPELQQYITATADGFRVEEGAMSLLSGAADQFSTGYIQAQIAMSETALRETQNRINLMQQELGIMGGLDYATVAAQTDAFVMTKNEFRRGSNSKGYADYEQYLASFLDEDLAASYAQRAELEKAIEEAQKNLTILHDFQENASTQQKKRSNATSTQKTTSYQTYQNEALDNELRRIEHLKAIGEYENRELDYIRDLKNARSSLARQQEERWQLDEKIYAAEQAYNKQKLDDYLDEISYREAMGKYDNDQAQKIADLTWAYNNLAKTKEDLRRLEQQIYQETKAYQQAEADRAQDAADAIEDIVGMRMKYIRQERELRKEALEEELEGYKKLYDAQADALDKQKEADDYAKTAAEKLREIAEIETRLSELAADTSAASQREQAELRAELAEKMEALEEYEKEQSIRRQKEKLEEEYALLEEQNSQKLDKIDEFLNNEGAVRDQAMADIMGRSETVYLELMEWNRQYGDGIDKTVTDAWKAATAALEEYGTQANALSIAENPEKIQAPAKTPSASASQARPATSSSGSASSASKAPVKGGRASVTNSQAISYSTSTGGNAWAWANRARAAGVSWNQKLYVTNMANGMVALGTTSKIGNTIAWVKLSDVKGYRSGSAYIPYDQLAMVDEAGPELIIRNPVQGRLTHLSRGDGVLNSTLTERLMALAQDPAAFLSQSMTKLSSAFGAGFAANSAPSVQIDSKVIVEGNADAQTVRALEKAEKRIAEQVFQQANKKYLRSGHTINPKKLG